MTPVLDPFKPFSAELHVIRRLNSSLHRADARRGPQAGRADSPHARCQPPAEPIIIPAPSRSDVTLLDPCCGQLSAGAEVDLGVKGRQKFIDYDQMASELPVPPGFRERPRTVPNPPSICEDLRDDRTSRRIPDAVMAARLSGSNGPGTAQRHSLRAPTTLHSSFLHKHTGSQDGFSSLHPPWTNSPALQGLRSTSASQRSYEEVGWDAKLHQHLKASGATLEKKGDPVSEFPSWKRYHSHPQLWQSIGAEWNRKQLRSRCDAKKPISFCSGCPRSGQIPLYTGTIGSENMENIDNMDEDFHPLTLKRSIIPPYTPTARRTTIPGYTGKALYANSSAVHFPSSPGPVHSSGMMQGLEVSSVGRLAPLSRMLTTVTPCNLS